MGATNSYPFPYTVRMTACRVPSSPTARRADFNREVSADSLTNRSPQTSSRSSSLRTTSPRRSTRYWSTSNTCGSTATSLPPRRNTTRVASSSQSLNSKIIPTPLVGDGCPFTDLSREHATSGHPGAARIGHSRAGAVEMTDEMRSEVDGVGADTVEEAGLAAAEEGQPQHVHPRHREHAAVMSQPTLPVEQLRVQPRVRRSESG